MDQASSFNTELFILLLTVLSLLLMLDIRRKLQKTNLPYKSPLILDSSALIDGRIIEVANTGFLTGRIIVPKFILNELQLLADGTDSHRRERARYGLDIAKELKDHSRLQVVIDYLYESHSAPTDERLLMLTKKRKGKLCTTDFNLNKVATVENVEVLNVNELAQSLRPAVLPGEIIKIKLIQKGESRDQAVGYLDDGTMIVVERAAGKIGKVVEARVERSLQTLAGRMIFAKYLH